MRSVSLLLMLALFVLPASAQITIDRTDLEAQVGLTFESFQWDARDNAAGSPRPDTTGLAAILNGADADFRTMVAGLNQIASLELMTMPADVPGADSFATATHVQEVTVLDITTQQDSTAYLFIELTNNAFNYLGYATALGFDVTQDGVADTIVTRNEPAGWTQAALPVAVGSTWQSMSTQVTWLSLPVVGLFRSESFIETREYEAVGTTTLTTPAGSEQALVIHLFEFLLFPQTPPVPDIRIAREQFTFIAESGLSVEVAYDIDFNTRQRIGLNDIAYFAPRGGGEPTTVETRDEEIPGAFELDQNYPNPFNPTTKIPFALTQTGHVQLTVYNVLGQHVATLVDEALPTGRYTADFQADGLPSGVYLYKLQVDGTVLSRAMLLQK